MDAAAPRRGHEDRKQSAVGIIIVETAAQPVCRLGFTHDDKKACGRKTKPVGFRDE